MNHEEILWKYIDGNCDPDEMLKIEQLIAADKKISSMYKSLMRIDGGLTNALEYASPINFTQSVISDAYHIKTKPATFKVIPMVFAVLLALVCISMYYPTVKNDYAHIFDLIQIPKLSQVHIVSSTAIIVGLTLLWIDALYGKVRQAKMLRV